MRNCNRFINVIFNVKPSFTVQNPRALLVKFDHVSKMMYLSISQQPCNFGLKMDESSKIQTTKFISQNDFFWAFTPRKVVIYQSIHLSELANFLTKHTCQCPEVFLPFKHISSHFFPLWRIYWTPDLQPSKLVCFVVNTESKNIQDS